MRPKFVLQGGYQRLTLKSVGSWMGEGNEEESTRTFYPGKRLQNKRFKRALSLQIGMLGIGCPLEVMSTLG